ncbi:MAG: FHA domain-containing protein [Chloroflexota bacterium]
MGRDREAQVRLSDNSVSHRYAVVSVRRDRVVLCDMGSRNGKRVNGERADPPSSKGGDVIDIARSKIAVMAPGKS